MNVSLGDYGIVDVSGVYDGYSLCRVVKPAPLGRMWLIETCECDYRTKELTWRKACRRKVSAFYPIGNQDPVVIYQALRDQMDALFSNLKTVRLQHHEAVKALASAAA